MRIKPTTMPIDRDLFGAISRYFNGRSHYEQSPRFHDFRARNDAFDYFQQAIGLGEEFEAVRALPITLETMIGFPDTRARHLRELREHTAACARLLSGPAADTVRIRSEEHTSELQS